MARRDISIDLRWTLAVCLASAFVFASCKKPRPTSHQAETTSPTLRKEADDDKSSEPTEQPAPEAPEKAEAEPAGDPAEASNRKADADEAKKGPPPPYKPHDLDALFRHLYRAESDERSERVSILHVGDSHTASDTITGRIRELFQDKFGSAGRGYAYAGEPWSTFRQEQMTYAMSRHWNTELGTVDDPKPPFPAGGVRIESSEEGAWVERAGCGMEKDQTEKERKKAREHCHYGEKFDGFAVHYLKQPDGGSFTVSVDGGRAALIETDADETSMGVYQNGVELGRHRIRIEVVDGPVALFGIRTMKGDDGIEYASLGINGATAPEFASFDRKLARQEIQALSPELIVFAFGTNEAYNLFRMQQNPRNSMEGITQRMATYQFEFDRLVERYQAAAPDASCLVMLPPDVAPKRKEVGCRDKVKIRGEEVCIPPTIRNFSGIVAIQRATAKRAGCAIWDQSHAMGGEGHIQRWAAMKPPLARSDGVHLTMDGYDLLAEAFFSDLMRTYEVWKSGGQMPLRTRPISRPSRPKASRSLRFGFD